MTLKNIALKNSLLNRMLLILAFFMLAQYAQANTTYYFKVTAKASQPTAAGKVYVDESDSENESKYSETDVQIDHSTGEEYSSSPSFTFFAKSNGGDYNYIQWKNGSTVVNQGELSNGKHQFTISPSLSTTSGKPTTITYTPYFYKTYVTATCDGQQCTKVTVSPSVNTLNANVSLTATLASGYAIVGWRKVGDTDIIAASSRKNPYTFKVTTETAGKYEPVTEASWVKVSTPNANKCTVAISNPNNYQGQSVKLTATLNGCYVTHWINKGTGEIVEASRLDETHGKNPWTLTVTERATYEPVLADAWVTVSSNNTNRGVATISNPNNHDGDVVTMTALSKNGNYYDVAWYKNGQLVSSDNPYTITVTERAEYVAHFDTQSSAPASGYYRFRSANPATSSHVISLEDNLFNMQTIIGSVSTFTEDAGISKAQTQLAQDIKMRSVSQSYTMPSTVIYLKPNGSQFNFIVQGTHIKQLSTGSFYGSNAGEVKTDGAYVDMSSANQAYTIGMTISAKHVNTGASDVLGPIYYTDNNGALIVIKNQDYRSAWYLEPISLDNNYFAAQPDAQISVNGKYYTTLRTSFPCQIPTGASMKVYHVTGVPTTSGEMATMVAYQPGDVVPAGMPVIIESTSTSPEDNKLMPVNDPENYISTNTSYTVSTALYNNYGAHRHDFGRQSSYNSSGVDRVPMSGDQVGYFKLNPDYSDYVSNTTPYYELSVNENGVVGFWKQVAQGTYSNKTFPKLDGNTAYSLIQCALFEDVTTTITLDKTEAYVGENILATISSVAEGANLQYSLDGGETWTPYDSPFNLPNTSAGTFTIMAKATKGYSESVIASANYTFNSAYQSITLAGLVNQNPSDTKYSITDLTAVCILDEPGLIICKDDNGYANKDVQSNEEWIDYMRTVSGLIPSTTEYDQSNWIVLQLPDGQELTADQMLAINNHQLTNVKGVLLNKENPTFQLDVIPTGCGDEVQSPLNTYIAASFGGTQESPVNQNTYFFVQPKPMELANIEWAYWDGSKFTTPPMLVGDNGQTWNLANLQGEFGYNREFLNLSLQEGVVYQMPNALIRVLNSSKYPNRADSQSKQYEVSPTSLTMEGSYVDGVITDVMQLGAQREVAGVEYYNLAGIRSTQPWQGINIVVTRYTDGTTSTTKRIKR